MDIKKQYNQIARKYLQAKKVLIPAQYIQEANFIKFCKNIKNKFAIDLACGNGYYTRILKKIGAQKVVGIDISIKQIEIAKQEEKKKSLGILYFIGDVTKFNFKKLRFFDIATGVFLLDYAPTKEKLLKMCRNTYNVLCPGGKFIALVDNSNAILPTNKKYGDALSANNKIPLKEGNKRRVTIYKGNKEVVHFYNYFWKRKTYHDALKKAGFKHIKWHNPIISKKALKIFGRKFWKEFVNNPTYLIIECRK